MWTAAGTDTPGPTAIPQQRGDLAGDGAGILGDVGPAVAEYPVSGRGGRIVTADVPPSATRRVRGLAIQLNDGPVGGIADVVIVAAAGTDIMQSCQQYLPPPHPPASDERHPQPVDRGGAPIPRG